MFEFGRDTCSNLAISEKLEWLVTNGIGGFASGTVAGLLTRRYHGLLIAALQPPVSRTLLVSKLDETAVYLNKKYPLYLNRWAGGVVEPNGNEQVEQFHLEGTIPVWTYTFCDALLEKRIWMQQGENTTYVQYHLRRGTAPLQIIARAHVNYRNYHGESHANSWEMQVEPLAAGVRVMAYDGASPIYLLTDRAHVEPKHKWHDRFFLMREANRGLSAIEDHLYAARFQITLQMGERVTFVFSTNATPNLNGDTAYVARRAYEQSLLDNVADICVDKPHRHALQQLVLAADQFVVKRPSPADPCGRTIIAGYPWFNDWGRDSMIALPGLTLTTRRPKIAAKILRTYANFIDQGMLPNRFPDSGETPAYNTVDATLWYFEAIRAYYTATQDKALIQELYPALQDIIAWHKQGTRFHIRMDPDDYLLYAGESGKQLTWMDAKVDNWVVTPRIGKPVEVNALWYNALCALSDFALLLGKDGRCYQEMATQVRQGFGRFWNEERGYCFDVIDGPDGNDDKLRPNQLLAVSLPHTPLEPERQKAIVDVCAQRLLTSYGLRSLDRDDPAYIGSYGGDIRQRDGAYHQGTVWAWLMGPFILAHLRVYNQPEVTRSFLTPLLQHLGSYGMGTIGEIFDGDSPFTPRGCIAQAWSVAEFLRACQATFEAKNYWIEQVGHEHSTAVH
jgi:predicted glycogen debranching enzyme